MLRVFYIGTNSLMLDLSDILGRKVDLVSKNGLKPLIRASVLGEARLLYAA
jgi:predicted nucleotidyltransferase